MVMELIEGPRVTELAGQLSINDAVKLVLQLAEGVSHMHSEGTFGGCTGNGEMGCQRGESHTMLTRNFTSRIVIVLELIYGLHYIIGPPRQLITAPGITLHHWPVQGIN